MFQGPVHHLHRSRGVPQGSTLGPLLIYINDMPATVKNKRLLYANDSCISVSQSGKIKNKIEIKTLLSDDLKNCKSLACGQ